MDLNALGNIPAWEWPEDADRIILKTLGNISADPEDRLLAVELAGDLTVMNDTLADALLTILQNADESDSLRARTAISFGPALEYGDIDGFEDPDEITISEKLFNKTNETLKQIFEDTRVPKEVRRRVLEASVRAPQNWHAAAVDTAYQSRDKDWKLTAVFCMGYIRGFEAKILESLDSDDPLIVEEAISAAGAWEITEAWPYIKNILTSEDAEKSMFLTAIEAAGMMDVPERAEIFTTLLTSDDEDVVDAVWEAMYMSDDAILDDDFFDDIADEDDYIQ